MTEATWPGFIAFVRTTRPLLAAILELAVLRSLERDHLQILIDRESPVGLCEENEEAVRQLAMKYFGDGVTLYIEAPAGASATLQ